jgi:hypothetical protein
MGVHLHDQDGRIEGAAGLVLGKYLVLRHVWPPAAFMEALHIHTYY